MSVLGYAQDLFKNPGRYRKFWVAIVGIGISLVSSYAPETPWLPVVIQTLTATGVFTVPNKN